MHIYSLIERSTKKRKIEYNERKILNYGNIKIGNSLDAEIIRIFFCIAQHTKNKDFKSTFFKLALKK